VRDVFLADFRPLSANWASFKCHSLPEHDNEHDNEFTVLKWPQHSPDLNPIEHIWDVVKQELCALDVHSTNLHQLLFLSIWANI